MELLIAVIVSFVLGTLVGYFVSKRIVKTDADETDPIESLNVYQNEWDDPMIFLELKSKRDFDRIADVKGCEILPFKVKRTDL